MTFKLKDKTTIINDILINILTNVDEVTDANVGSVIRNIVEALGIEVSDLYSELQEIYNGTRIELASGVDLENLGAIVGITRKSGTHSNGYVTFYRKTPATTDFIIPTGSLVSTQPNTAEEQLRFKVKNNTTFKSIITDEKHKFINGLYSYNMDERFIDSIQEVRGTSGGSPRVFIQGTDYELVKNASEMILKPDELIVIDDCDSTTGWNNSPGAEIIVLDNIDYKQGIGSLKLGKTTTTEDTIYYDKILGSVLDGSKKNVYLWLKISDNATLNKIKKITITTGNNGIGNSYSLDFEQKDLKTGWNMLKTDYTLATSLKTGYPNPSAFNYIRITIQTNNVNDVIVSGDIKMDFWAFSVSEDYEGDLILFRQSGTLPDNGTEFFVGYKPLSKEVFCESENVGAKYNTRKKKITYKVSYIPNIDNIKNYKDMLNGTDRETDNDLRDRIKMATELKGKATKEALRQAILAVEGVTSVSVDDMPLKTQAIETHRHISFALTPTQALDYEVAQLDTPPLLVWGTRGGGPYTFVRNTDYYLQDSTIIWIDDIRNPDDNTDFNVTYNYRWLGHVEIFVAGVTAPLPEEVVININKAINDTRAAGIYVTWREPTVVLVNVTIKVYPKTAEGYTFSGISPNVKSAIENYLNNKQVGADVLIAEIIDTAMEVEGVYNCIVENPDSDVIINIDEVARPGAISVISF